MSLAENNGRFQDSIHFGLEQFSTQQDPTQPLQSDSNRKQNTLWLFSVKVTVSELKF